MDKAKGFAERLKILRNVFSVSQVQLAEYLCVKQYYIAKWEAGVYEPSDEIKNRISNYFCVSNIWLVNGVKPIFRGITFIPTLLTFNIRNGLSLQKVLNFLKLDVAILYGMHYLTDDPKEKWYKIKSSVILTFRRVDNSLLLFLPYTSTSATTPNLFAYEVTDCLDKTYGIKPEGIEYKLGFFREDEFYSINSSMTTQDIKEKIGIEISDTLKKESIPLKTTKEIGNVPHAFIDRLKKDIRKAKIYKDKNKIENVLKGEYILSRKEVIKIASDLGQPIEEYLFLSGYIPDEFIDVLTHDGMVSMFMSFSKLSSKDVEKMIDAINKIINIYTSKRTN